MKANEYIKEYGWDVAKKAVSICNYGYGIDLDELKRLVESLELVEKHGGIDSLNDLFYVYGISSARVMKVGDLTYAKAMKAIEDVESCQ